MPSAAVITVVQKVRVNSYFAAGFDTCKYVVLFGISSQREREREGERWLLYSNCILVFCLSLFVCYLMSNQTKHTYSIKEVKATHELS